MARYSFRYAYTCSGKSLVSFVVPVKVLYYLSKIDSASNNKTLPTLHDSIQARSSWSQSFDYTTAHFKEHSFYILDLYGWADTNHHKNDCYIINARNVINKRSNEPQLLIFQNASVEPI